MGIFSSIIGAVVPGLIGGASNAAGQALNRRDQERLMELEEQIYQRNSFQDQNNPFGSSTWGRTDDGRWVQNSQYSAEVQPLFTRALESAMAGRPEYDPFAYRPAGLGSLVQNQMARMGDRGGIDLRPEMAASRERMARPAMSRPSLAQDIEERLADPGAGPPDVAYGRQNPRSSIRPPRFRP